MADESKSPKKGSITEEDAASLLERYPVETVLTLLQEVEQVAGEKIDWDELVKNTATGISCAREYQMLWRHLAYGKTLEDQSDSDAKPMDDDSDLEYELEASPAVSHEELAEAEAYVKVLIASGSNDPHLPDDSTIDAPLTINIRSSKASTASSDSSHPADAIQGKNVTIPVSVQKSTGGLTPRIKRREWSEEEDMKLTAAVQKYGELDWVTIATEDFLNDRSTSELSKRWTTLTKELHHSNVGSSSQLSETELAAAHGAMPMGNIHIEPQIPPLNASASQPGEQFSKRGPPISNVPKKSSPMTHATVSDPVIAAASSVMRTYRGSTNQLPSNAHFIRYGLGKARASSYSAPIHSSARAVQSDPTVAARVLSVSSENTNSTASIPFVELTKCAEGAGVSTSGSGMKDLVQKDETSYQSDSPISAPVEQRPHNQSSQSEETGYEASVSSTDPSNQTLDADVAMQCSEDEELGNEGVEATSSNSIATAEDDDE